MALLQLAAIRQMFAVGAFSLLTAACAIDPTGTPIAAVNEDGGLALKGYDPVAYFISGRPTLGANQFVAERQGATYRFASADDRDLFVADPDKYVPQYGGYCAYAISVNRIADIDPEEWAIVGDKLYLNNDRLAQALWSLDKQGSIKSGDRNWAAAPKVPVNGAG
jgi:hypothetical protein